MSQETGSLLTKIKKRLKISPKELDLFINAKGTSTKYYLENYYGKNKLFRYLLLLRLKGASLDKFFDRYIKENNVKKPKNE